MNRCSDRPNAGVCHGRRARHVFSATAWTLGLTLALPSLCVAQSADATAAEPQIGWRTRSSTAPVPMALQRLLPPASLRGVMTLTHPQSALVNGQPETVAPGVRVRNASNMLVTPALIIGQKLTVNYVRDGMGLIEQIWILRDDERARLWPKTTEEAAKWAYDPYTQSWTKP